MMGRRNQDQGQLFFTFGLDAVVPGDQPRTRDRGRSRLELGLQRVGAALSNDGPTVD